MSKLKAFTSSERRGILIVAAITLIITGFGFFNFKPSEAETIPEIPEVEILEKTDSLLIDSAKSRKGAKTGKKSGKRKAAKKSKKVYPKRSPLDEPV